jgi:histidinol-phosphate aminotransferase
MSLKHIRPDVLAMPDASVAFATAEQVAARQGLPVERILKLDANENMYGPSPKVLTALRECAAWNVYPDISHQPLDQALASYAGVQPEQIVVTSGCDELILMLAQLLIRPGTEMIDCVPSFGVYAKAVRIQGGDIVAVPRLSESNYALDVATVLRAISERTRLIFVCNPNNQTGGLTSERDIAALLETGVMVAIDETYYEFAGVTMLPLLARYDNLVIMRSLSKWAGLAGLRIGYGIFAPDVARQMRKLRMPFNVNLAGYIAALASVEDKDYLLANVARIVSERERLYRALARMPFLHRYPSHGNFILCTVSGVPARVLRNEVEREGVLLRVYDGPYLANGIRFSIGRPEHTEAAIAALHVAGRRLNLV